MLVGQSRGQGALMLEDLDPAETREWVEALDSVLAFEGADRAFYLLDEVTAEARRKGAPVPYSATTPYLNTIPPDKGVRLAEEQLTQSRQEVDGGDLSSYPHPWLMPDYWQMPTVSMGLGPIMAIY